MFSFCFGRVKDYPVKLRFLIQMFLLVLHCIQIFATLPIKMSCATVAFKCPAGRRIHHLNIHSRKSKEILRWNISPQYFTTFVWHFVNKSCQFLSANAKGIFFIIRFGWINHYATYYTLFIWLTRCTYLSDMHSALHTLVHCIWM